MRIFYKFCHGHPNPYFQRVRSTYEKRYMKEHIAERVHKRDQNNA